MEKKGDKNGKRGTSNSTSRNRRTTKVSTSKKSSVDGSNSETRRINTVSDETKRYKISEEDLNKKTKVAKNGTSKKSNKKKKSKAWNIIKKILIALVILGILAGLIAAGIIAGIFFGFFGDDFKMTKADLVIPYINTEIYDIDGNFLGETSGTEQRQLVSLNDMPKLLPKAYVAIEDERFYDHSGVDIKRTGAATITYLLNRGNSSFGGSTITQQLIKNITKEDEDSALRKVKEMARAIQIEKEISKDNILELYLNDIFVGGESIHGVALGAKYYFNKNVSDLDLAECAFLAGINHTPNSYNPYNGTEEQIAKRIERGRDRTKVVLKKMLELNYVSQEEYNTAVAKVDGGLTFERGVLATGTVYSDHTEAAIEQVIKQLMEEKGMERTVAENLIYGGGYKIYTTQSSKVQTAIEEVMADPSYVRTDRATGDTSQAAIVVIDHKTGYVVGCAGRLGTKTKNGDLNRIYSARQVGSAMKPLSVVAPGIQENVINPESMYKDEPIDWYGSSVKNHYNGFHNKFETVRDAIRVSGNIVPIKIIRDIGVLKSVEYLNKMGLDGLEKFTDKSYSLALGAKEYSPLKIAGAYATLANDGTYIEPTFYTKVVDRDGNVVLEPHQKTERVFGASETYIVKSILTEPVKSGGTATLCANGMNGFDICAKTGSSDGDKDRWLGEFTTYYTAVCWYGFDQNNTNVSGLSPATQICSNVMRRIHSGLTPTRFVRPDDVVTATVCSRSNRLPGAGCPTVTGLFVRSKIPTTRCSAEHNIEKIKICEETGLLAVEGGCPNVVEKMFENDEERPTEYCNVHTKPEESPEPTPTETTSPKPTETTSPKPTETTSPKPTGTTSPTPTGTTSPKPTETTSPKPTSTTSPSPSTSPIPSGSPKPEE